MEKFDKVDIEDALTRAKSAFMRHERHLLEVGAGERCMAHRFAMCLQCEFPVWHVDCEYNRTHIPNTPKHIYNDKRHQTPDIIVHHRGIAGRQANLLVIESKPNEDSNAVDCDRLVHFMSNVMFHYQFAALLNFNTSDCDVTWILRQAAEVE